MTEDEKNLNPEDETNNTPEAENDTPEAELVDSADDSKKDVVPTASQANAKDDGEPDFMRDLREVGNELSGLPGWVWWAVIIFVLLGIVLALRSTPAPAPQFTEAEETSTAEFAALVEMGTAVPEIQATADAAMEMQGTIDANDEQIATLEGSIAEQEAMMQEQQTAIAEQDTMMEQQEEMMEEQESVIANATATLQAVNALLFAQERSLADAQEEAQANADAVATAQADAQTNADALATAQAGGTGDDEALAAAEEELEDSNNALATAQAQVDSLSTQQVELAEQAEMLDDVEVMESRIDSLEEDIIAFQADATTRALQIESIYATSTAQAEGSMVVTVEALQATATAQAEVIATQQVQLDSIRDMIGSLGTEGEGGE